MEISEIKACLTIQETLRHYNLAPSNKNFTARLATVNCLELENSFVAHYYIKDHLGNIRTEFKEEANESGTDISAVVLGEYNYYPFGELIPGEGIDVSENQYLYNGKERQEELGIEYYNYGARFYDPSIGRMISVDPAAESFSNLSPYNYAVNNPLRFIDPDGRFSTEVTANDDGTYTVAGGDANDGDNNIYVVTQNEEGQNTRTGETIGESITSHSFFDENENAVVGAVIDPGSTEGQDFIDNEIVGADPNLAEYIPNAGNGDALDIKDRGLENIPEGVTEIQHRYRGSISSDGKIGSARDFGNIGAGIVAARNGLTWKGARLGFDAYQSFRSGSFTREAETTQKSQRVGFGIGIKLRPPKPKRKFSGSSGRMY